MKPFLHLLCKGRLYYTVGSRAIDPGFSHCVRLALLPASWHTARIQKLVEMNVFPGHASCRQQFYSAFHHRWRPTQISLTFRYIYLSGIDIGLLQVICNQTTRTVPSGIVGFLGKNRNKLKISFPFILQLLHHIEAIQVSLGTRTKQEQHLAISICVVSAFQQ